MDFYKEVIERSRVIPVVVDFWAPWCGPCRFLGPMIEELASQANGKWELAKLNTDEYPEISRHYHIQGIPAVKMFYNEEVVAEFVGALPKHQIEQWLEKNLPDKRKKEFVDILKKLDGQEHPDLSDLETFVKSNEDFLEARVELARLIALQKPLEAAKLLKDVKPGNKFYPQAEDIFAIKALMTCDFNQNETLSKMIQTGKEGLEDGDLEKSIDALIQAVMIDKGYCDELPRKSVIAIFNLLGSDHELTRKFRKRFDMALY